MADYPVLRLNLSNLAHSISARHGEASYFRPLYYSLLFESLTRQDQDAIKKIALGEVIDAIEAQTNKPVPHELYDLFWVAFGKERIDERTNVMGRSRAAKVFDTLVGEGIPARVAAQAREIHSSPLSGFEPRILTLPKWTASSRRTSNQLSVLETVEALAMWKQGELAPNVESFQGWITDTIHSQVKYRFAVGVADGVEFQDVLQDVITGVLQRLCVYQPKKLQTLERWLFGTMVNGVRMAVRKYGDQYFRVHKSDGEGILITSEISAEDRFDNNRVELIEYAITKVNAIDKRRGAQKRVSALLDSLDIFLEVKPANTSEDLKEQLRSLFPSFGNTAVEQIVALSNLNTSEEVS